MLYDEYEAYVDKYVAEFGKRTIVLYECGSFFEMYDDGSCKTNLQEIGDLLNIIVSRRNKNIIEVSRSNCEMAGFPTHALKKFLGILLSNNYTIVLVRQVTPPPNPKREVTEVLSPGTNIDVSGGESNNLMVIQIDEVEKYGASGFDICMGCACIDVSTGKAMVYEATTHKRDSSYVYDEIQRILMTYKPREIEVFNTDVLKNVTFHKVCESVDWGNAYVHNRMDATGSSCKKYCKPRYQEQVLSLVYTNRGVLTSLEYLDLDKYPYAATCFTRVIEFTHMHNENIIKKLEKPIIKTDNDILILSSTAIQQLDLTKRNITNDGGSLLDILNVSKTAIGKRYFRERLLCPRTSTTDIETDLDIMDMVTNDQVKEIRGLLQKVYDVERLFRKCRLNRIHPHEFGNIYISLCNLEKCYRVLNASSSSTDVISSIKEMISFFEYHFDVDKLGMYSIDAISDAGLFKHQPYNLISLCDHVNYAKTCIEEFVSQYMDGTVKMDVTDKDGINLTMTLKRYQESSKSYPNKKFTIKDPCYTESSEPKKHHTFTWKDINVKTMTSYVRITHPIIEQHNTMFIEYQRRVCKESEIAFKSVISQFVDDFGGGLSNDDIFHDIVDAIARIDWLTTCKHNAIQMRLERPMFESNTSSCGGFDIKGLRHLLIEKYQQDIPYVSNDVALNENGMLLYGINSSGKSSLMKAIGLAVIMAQAGMYVPCDSMRISPFKSLFTRILTGDDIQRGYSTFTKEILELRNILSRANAHSLVIGDELCAGTESSSALAIVAAGIVTLAKKNSSFVFATHLHDLVTLPEISDNPKVRVYHLAVHCDPITNKLIYDRKLQQGSGSSLYGIEVCRSMDMDPEFLKIANSIRQRYTGVSNELDVGVNSRYNAAIMIGKCQVCGKDADEVHHIQQQKDADEGGYIGRYHKNRQSNLAALCTTCHDNVHNGRLRISGYVSSLDGKHLLVEQKESNDSLNDDLLHDIIGTFSDTVNFTTNKMRYEHLISKWNVTKYRITQLWKKHNHNSFH